MANYTELDLEIRETLGSVASKTLRSEGKIPANFYFHGEDNQNLVLDKGVFHKAIQSGSHIFEVELEGRKRHVMVKSVQYHPVTEEIIHIDLQGVHMSEKIGISIPIILEGESLGVKDGGGVLMQNLSTLDIQCLPSDVPENVVMDITDLDINQNFTVNDISLGDEIEIINPGDTTVVTIQPPVTEVELELPEEELAEGEEPEDGEDVVDGEKVKEGDDPSERASKQEFSDDKKEAKEKP
ncbi:MAG: 50S ribosomal protein L25 [Candidatus Marinimicrobia bacterium]|jgi:large subunit ribosomal protein L25|nr:50S ribosomal protein L25 [Candidatus Neomarinimicrobiota bacterium]MBT3617380.1 50S ribosomal protein L25 [Candidatus Neomarinimicrobiota bacterium]MBT3829320.1 50S ribosomal protein L25 [Candidatus Neomarinimicrobiota bacterium]MBT3998278.1 50S ribosomal protein L25 [Candidatus Neomarinimicrobiota bacterium]MBT4281579.1 50S ribosomal protein L25 [Candidatus Neomarinimicrobiota bacterium]